MSFAYLVKTCSSSTNRLLATIFGQTVIMGFAWGFIGATLYTRVLALPDHIVHLIVEHPTVLTLIVTLISTTLSIITSLFFTFAIKEALQHYLSGWSMSLSEFRIAMALSSSTCVWPWKYRTLLTWMLSVLTLVVSAMVAYLSSSWSTFLLPTVVQWPVPMFGTELDLGSVAFVSQLSTDLNAQQAITAQVPGFQTIDVLTLLSGISAVDDQSGMQTSSMFSFNGVSYNRSTGGVLPAIEDYSGSSNPPGSAVGLEFSGGRVPVNTNVDWPNRRDNGTTGIAQNYTVTQQGLTADVSCQPIDRSQNSFNVTTTPTQGPLVTFLTHVAVANCSGNLNAQPYFTVTNVSGQDAIAIEGFIPTVVCPDPNSMTSDLYKFDVFMSGVGDYNFLQTTVCEVVPYLTTVNVTYNGGIISVDRIGASTSSPDFPLFQYIATVMAYQATTSQAMITNPIGNFLTAYGASNVSVMHSELEDYWRGIAEFASTQLRSGYSASGVPSDMTRPTNGTMYITTYGWQSKTYTYILLLVVITVIWGATVLAAGWSLIQEQIHASDPSFDFSNPIHLAIVAYRGGCESQLHNGDKNGVYISEDTTVRFEGEGINKRLVTG